VDQAEKEPDLAFAINASGPELLATARLKTLARR
jgi:dTDP-4-dehydrorhamnose reductase